MKAPVPAFALSRPRFPAPALLRAAAEAPHGGGREALMAGVMAVRLLSACLGPSALSPETRARRADAIRAWLPAVTLDPSIRTAILRAVAASEGTATPSAAVALEALSEAIGGALGIGYPRAARLEVAGLVARLRRG